MHRTLIVLAAVIALVAVPMPAPANNSIWSYATKVVRISSYIGDYTPNDGSGPLHAVWFKDPLPASECTQGWVWLDESKTGGKSALSLLTSAYFAGKTVLAEMSGCTLKQIYVQD
jgi:hypothetical protein